MTDQQQTTITKPVLVYVASTKTRDITTERTYGKGQEPCYLCGRPLEGDVQQIETYYGSDIVVAGEIDVNDPAYSGAFSIGPECAKRVRAAAKAVLA